MVSLSREGLIEATPTLAQLQAALDASMLLHQVSTDLIHERDEAVLYERIVDAAAAIMRSPYATMQMFHPERGPAGELRLLAYRGFAPTAAAFWAWVSAESPCICGHALRLGRRAVVADVDTCEFLAGTEHQAAYRSAGIFAMQSTPLYSRAGGLVGMISTHWERPHEPPSRDLRLFDILARQAADVIERVRGAARMS